MHTQPLIKQGWLRALLFLIALTVVIVLITNFTKPLWQSPQAVANAAAGEETNTNQLMLFSSLLVASVASFLMVLIFRRLIDRSPVATPGLTWRGYGAHAATGFFLGPLLIGMGSFVFILLKSLEWTDLQADPEQLFLSMGLMVIIAFTEELVFRGYLLNNLMQSMNKWIALLLSALIFAFFHSNNPAMSIFPLVNVFLGGLLLGINYIYTRNLWFGIFFHFTWNFYQGGILGYDVSGLRLYSLVQQKRSGSTWLSGGDFGFEGSVICTVLSLLALLLLAWVYEKKARLLEI